MEIVLRNKCSNKTRFIPFLIKKSFGGQWLEFVGIIITSARLDDGYWAAETNAEWFLLTESGIENWLVRCQRHIHVPLKQCKWWQMWFYNDLDGRRRRLLCLSYYARGTVIQTAAVPTCKLFGYICVPTHYLIYLRCRLIWGEIETELLPAS